MSMQTRFNTENAVLGLAYGLISILRNPLSVKQCAYALAKPVAFVYTAGYVLGERFHNTRSFA